MLSQPVLESNTHIFDARGVARRFRHSAIQPFLAVLRCRDPTTNTATFPPTPTIRPSIQMDAELMTMFQALVARVSAHGEIAAAALRHQVLAALK